MENVLNPDQIKRFQDDGILVIPNILSEEQIQSSLTKLHETLLNNHGVNTQNLKSTGHNLVNLSSTNGSGGVLDLFYPNFKLDIATNETLFRATCELWKSCFRTEDKIPQSDEEQRESIPDWKDHPYEGFDCNKGYLYMDRIGFRLPTTIAEEIGNSLQSQQGAEVNEKDSNKKKENKNKRSRVSIQRSLTPHLDCCPDTINSAENKSKWRPIQCFVSLTDNLHPNTGGFEAVRGGFHKEFNTWSKIRPKTIFRKHGEIIGEISPPCIGEYTHMRPKEDADVMQSVEHISVPRGSAVLWDNRIPHANAYKNNSDDTRIVVYCSFLPDIQLNRDYASKQLDDYSNGKIPRDQWIEQGSNQNEENGDIKLAPEEYIDSHYNFTPLGRKLMMIHKWP